MMKQFALVVLVFAGFAAAPPAAAEPSPLLMHRLLSHPDVGNRDYMGERFMRLEDVQAFYAARNYQPVWTRERLEMLSYALIAAQRAGLQPQQFHMQALGREFTNDNEMAIELLATDAWMSLAAAMLGGAQGTNLPVYFETQLAEGRVYQGIAELAAFRAGRQTLPTNWPTK